MGTKDELYGRAFTASRLNWIAIKELKKPINVTTKIRYRHKEAEAVVAPLDEDRVFVNFKESQMAITPGQAAVFYDGDIVIGGGVIQ